MGLLQAVFPAGPVDFREIPVDGRLGGLEPSGYQCYRAFEQKNSLAVQLFHNGDLLVLGKAVHRHGGLGQHLICLLYTSTGPRVPEEDEV